MKAMMNKQLLGMLAGMIGMSACVSNTVTAKVETAEPPAPATYYYDGGRKQQLWVNPDEIAEFGSTEATDSPVAKSVLPQATLMKAVGTTRIWRVETPTTAKTLTQSKAVENAAFSPVFRSIAAASAPRMALPGNIFVTFKADWTPAQIDDWVRSRNLTVIEQLAYDPRTYVIKTEPGIAALELANELQQSGEVESATPNWWREVFTR